MKILIWVIGYIVMTLLHIVIPPMTEILSVDRYSLSYSFVGFIDAVIYLLVWIFVSITLCKKWDASKANKQLLELKQKAESQGLTIDDVMRKEIPDCIFDFAEQDKGFPDDLSKRLRGYVKQGLINKVQAEYLFELYSKK